MIRRHFLPAVTVCALGLLPADRLLASDLLPHEVPADHYSALPAVSGVNGKIDIFGGAYEAGGIAGVGGALSIPLGFRFGTQIDGLVASLDDEGLVSISDHIFWRDPSHGLLGLYGSLGHYEGFGGVNTYRLAVEGELYRGRTTLRGIVGVEGGDADATVIGGLTFDFEVDTRAFDKLDVVFYPTDNLQLFVGHRYIGGIHAAAAGAEYLWRSDEHMGTSTFIEGRVGEDDSQAVWAGLRFYLGGENKNLMRRHREDDPSLWEPDSHLGIVPQLEQTRPNVIPIT
jgi:hypothetical protein